MLAASLPLLCEERICLDAHTIVRRSTSRASTCPLVRCLHLRLLNRRAIRRLPTGIVRPLLPLLISLRNFMGPFDALSYRPMQNWRRVVLLS